MTFPKRVLPFLALAATLAVGACKNTQRMAMGNVNSIIVVAPDSLWAQVEDTVMTTLQPRIFAVRSEPTFKLTYTSPTSEDWRDLRRFRQILAIGQPDDAWVKAAIDAADTTVTPPAIVEADDVWARSQRVTALVLPPTGQADVVRSTVDSLASLLNNRYIAYVHARMYISGHDTTLVDTLRRDGRFSLDMPNVYRWKQVGDSAFLFINDNPDASQLVRSLLVTWETRPDQPPAVEPTLAWRDSVAEKYYDWGMTTDRSPVETHELSTPGAGGLEIRGVWSGTLKDFPQAGPFIARVIDCPAQNRRYLLDAWLYAPARDKYQYMIQLETLLNSFECGG